MTDSHHTMPEWMQSARDSALSRMECLGCGQSLRGVEFRQKGGVVSCAACAERLAAPIGPPSRTDAVALLTAARAEPTGVKEISRWAQSWDRPDAVLDPVLRDVLSEVARTVSAGSGADAARIDIWLERLRHEGT